MATLTGTSRPTQAPGDLPSATCNKTSCSSRRIMSSSSDVDGNRYDIPDYQELDAKSRKYIEDLL